MLPVVLLSPFAMSLPVQLVVFGVGRVWVAVTAVVVLLGAGQRSMVVRGAGCWCAVDDRNCKFQKIWAGED